MKKILLLAVAIACIGLANAQEKTVNNGLKRTSWGIGQIQYQDDEAKDEKQFTIMAIAGTFITPDIAIGAGFGYTYTTVKQDDRDAITTFIMMPLVRKYWKINNKFYLFGQADVPFKVYDDAIGYGLNFHPGIDFFLSSKFTLEATFGAFGYNAIQRTNNSDAIRVTNIGFNMNEIKIGIKYIF